MSDTTKTEFSRQILIQSDQKIWQKYCRAELNNLSKPLTCWVFLSVLREGFSGI